MPSLLHLRPNSAATYSAHLRNHVYPALGDRRIGTITRSDVQSFVTAISATLAPATTETVYAVLRAMMQAAVSDDPQVIPASPSRGSGCRRPSGGSSSRCRPPRSRRCTRPSRRGTG